MAIEDKRGTKLKAYCGRCRGDRNCEVLGHHHESGEEADGYYMWQTDWYLLTCCGCDYVFAQTVSTNSEDYHNYYNEIGETETDYHETVQTWPARAKRQRPDWFQHGTIETEREDTFALSASLNELYGALDHDLLVLAAIGMRTSLDIAAALLDIDPAETFASKVDSLAEKGLIRETEKDHISTLIDAGSASAHRGWRPGVAELDPLMDILEAFIFDNMVLPAQRAASAGKLAGVQAKLPKKPMRKQKKNEEKMTAAEPDEFAPIIVAPDESSGRDQSSEGGALS